MKDNRYDVDDIVIYQNGSLFELGIIKEVIPQGKPLKNIFDETTYASYKYRVYYHTGDTSAVTDEHLLHAIHNEYAFLIMRRKADTSSIDETPARELAASIIDHTPMLTDLEGDAYFDTEDTFTEIINNWKG